MILLATYLSGTLAGFTMHYAINLDRKGNDVAAMTGANAGVALVSAAIWPILLAITTFLVTRHLARGAWRRFNDQSWRRGRC